MKYIKRKDRIEKGGRDLLKVIPKVGGSTKWLDRYSKWCECYQGRLLDHLDLWEIAMPDGQSGCFLVDPLGRLACPLEEKEDVLCWLKDHEWNREQEDEDDECEEEEV